MKKTLIAVAAAAALTTSAFAEVTFGGFGRQIWAPVASDGKDTRTVYSTSWGTPIRFGYGFDYKSDNVDFHADFHLDNGVAEINDQVKTTVRLADGVEVAIGKIQIDDLRGNCCFGQWDMLRAANVIGEDVTMSRLMNDYGVATKITAVDNLLIVAGLPVVHGAESAEIFKDIRVGAAYTIEGVGVLKANFQGDADYDPTDVTADAIDDKVTGRFEAAFTLTSVENLTAEVGFGMMIQDADSATDIAATATYKVNDATNVSALVKVTLQPGDLDPTINFGAGVDYALDNGIGLFGDVRCQMADESVQADTTTSFAIGAKKGFSNGNIAVAFQGASKCGMTGVAPAAGKDFVWALPIAITYYF